MFIRLRDMSNRINNIKMISKYFERFCKNFRYFDGQVIANLFTHQLIVVNSSGNIFNYESPKEIAEYFQNCLDQYQFQGVESCKFTDLDIAQINGATFLAAVSWELLDKSQKVVLSWRESYCLVQNQNGLKAMATYDHA